MPNEVRITQMQDVNGNPIAPLTPEAAIYDANGVRLNQKMENLKDYIPEATAENKGLMSTEQVETLQVHRDNLADLNTTILNYNRKIDNFTPVNKATVVANLGTAAERGMIVTYYSADGWKSIRYVSSQATAEAFADVNNWIDVEDFSVEDKIALDFIVNDISPLPNDWNGKIITTYGDSVTALQGGDFLYPYSLTNTQKWGNRVADYFKMSKHYGRGIGGQKYVWDTNGGSITWVYKDTGIMIDRNDAFNLDDWDGSSFPSTWTEAQKGTILSGLANGSVVSIRGCMCSWLRIISMYPTQIKDSIDAVFVMCHNDSVDGNEFVWVEGDTTDLEWAASEQYATYGGDYNISTLEGGIASTIMKLQAWLPNAVIILGTPINGQGTTGQLRPDANGLYRQVEHVKNVGFRFSIPVIDVYATCGINGLNRTDYITDTIHPYSVAGSKMIARAIIGGFKTILPKL